MKPPTQLDHDARTFLRVLTRDGVYAAWPLVQLHGNLDTIRNALDQGRQFVSAYGLDSMRLVGWNVVKIEETQATLTYELHGKPGSAVVSIQVVRSDSSSRVTGFHWQPTAAPLADVNAFSLHGRSVAHYAYLVLAVLAALACIGGAIFAGVRRLGVFWVLFCLVGVGRATINWSTGEQSFNPFSVELFGAGYLRPGIVGPWFVAWSLPLGTILALLRSRRQRVNKPPETPPVAA